MRKKSFSEEIPLFGGDNIKRNLKEYEKAWTESIGGSCVQAFEHSGIIDGLLKVSFS